VDFALMFFHIGQLRLVDKPKFSNSHAITN